MNQDLEHLKILSIFHYVVAGFAALFASFPIIHLVIGLSMLSGNFFGEDIPSEAFPEAELFGLMFTIIPAVMILLGWAFAIALVFAGRYLGKQQRYTFCLVMAGISCLFMPFGTVLGVFTIIVLMRPSVKELFGVNHKNTNEPAA
ncbi:MAG: hypothetical protein GY805_10065 [Chloroflexi bacterium]|nr:hypothetical protein [Chloroflexota bacterium]